MTPRDWLKMYNIARPMFITLFIISASIIPLAAVLTGGCVLAVYIVWVVYVMCEGALQAPLHFIKCTGGIGLLVTLSLLGSAGIMYLVGDQVTCNVQLFYAGLGGALTLMAVVIGMEHWRISADDDA